MISPWEGPLLYVTKQVVHTQYISANIEGKELGVLDLLFDYLINTQTILILILGNQQRIWGVF